MRYLKVQCPNLGKERGVVKMQDKPLGLPRGYILDASDTAALVLRRLDGSSVAAFSARGVDPTEIRKTAEEDLRNLAERDERLPSVLRNTRTATRVRPPQRGTAPRRH
jgi:hypothetical protein